MRFAATLLRLPALAVAACSGVDEVIPDDPIVIITDAGPDGRPNQGIDAAGILPDLVALPEGIATSVLISEESFTIDSCEVLEGCVGGPGLRRLLRFDFTSANQGNGDLLVGEPPAPGVNQGLFVWSACHGHHHVEHYADYKLRDADTERSGHKQAFCLEDTYQLDPNYPGQNFSCTYQGLSVGWGDTYQRHLPCQWIDVTGIAPGIYTLEVTVNPERNLPESDFTNNVVQVQVAL